MDNNNNPIPTNDWHYSWMFTGQQNNASSGSSFRRQYRDLREPPVRNHQHGRHRPQSTTGGASRPTRSMARRWSRRSSATAPISRRRPAAQRRLRRQRRSHRPVALVREPDRPRGEGGRLDRRRDLRTKCHRRADPVLEFPAVPGRGPTGTFGGLQNPYNKLEWDNLPAQRCFWYRVQKVMPATDDPTLAATFRSMVVYVDRTLQARTPLNGGGQPYSLSTRP